MHRFRTGAFVIGGLLAVVLAGCDRLEDVVGPDPDEDPLFTRIQTEIFSPQCAGCHSAGGAAGLNLSGEDASFGSLVGVSALFSPNLLRVDPGDPENSFLVIKLEGGERLIGQRMPAGGAPPLPAEQIQMVRDWIAEGALRD